MKIGVRMEGVCPLSRGGGRKSRRRADQFRKVQARRRGGGEEPITAARRAAVAKRAGADAAVSEEGLADSPVRASRASWTASPGGRAAGEKQVRAPAGEGAGQDERLSEGQDGHAGGASGQQPAGIAAAGAGQIASTVRAALTGSIPATSASATRKRADTACRSLTERMVPKIRASFGIGVSQRGASPRRSGEAPRACTAHGSRSSRRWPYRITSRSFPSTISPSHSRRISPWSASRGAPMRSWCVRTSVRGRTFAARHPRSGPEVWYRAW